VCEACIYYDANGADSYFDGHDDELERVAQAFTDSRISISWVYPEDENEPDGFRYDDGPIVEAFSKTPCAVCGTHFAGSRHHAVVRKDAFA